MRHISFGKKRPNKKWAIKAARLLIELENAADADARAKIIDDNASVWGELKDWLLSLSHEKCWFSEAKDCFNYWHVEHFRPKKSAKDLDGTVHDGYWWLAFNWRNFRICGSVGNTKKGTFFPLRPSDTRATGKSFDLRYEHPLLLDPADDDDPTMLSFNFRGKAIVAPDIKDSWSKQRAAYSIERYNLNYSQLVVHRKAVWDACSQEIKQYKIELAKAENDNDTIAYHEARKLAKALRERTYAEKEFSAVARACILSTGDKRVMRILQSA